MKTIKLAVAIAVAGVASALFAELPGVTWYVDAAASAGGSGLTPQSAFQTIGEAVDAAASGDTVQIAAGTYAENVVVEGKALTIVGAGRDATVIDANGSGRPLYLKGADVTGTRVKSLCLANGSADVGGGLYVDTADVDVGFVDGKITDCVTTGNGAAVNGPAWVVRSLIGRCYATGDEMAVFTGVKGLFSSVIINCGRGAMADGLNTKTLSPVLDTYASGDQIKVVNCTFSNNSGFLTKYVTESLGQLVIRNCAFFGIQTRWMRKSMNLQYCFGSLAGVLPNGQNNIGGDLPATHAGERWPTTEFQVVAPFSDWRPLTGSDLVDNGNSSFVTDLVPEEYRGTDYYGNTRIQGSAVDMGAAEGAVSPTGGIVFFPMQANWSSFICATNLWINGYRAISPETFVNSSSSTRMANGIHFASTEANRAAALKFEYPADRRFAIWGFTNQTGTATHPNWKGMFTFVLPGTAGVVESNWLVNAASIRWVSPDGNNSAAGTSSDAPYRTLQKANDGSSQYGVVFAKPGTYAEGGLLGVTDTDNVNTTSNRLFISKNIYIVSTDGPEATVIKGERDAGSDEYDGCGPGAMRCVQLSNAGTYKACVCGFTLTGGATDANPIANRKEGKPGDNIFRGNFGGSAAQGYVWASGKKWNLQVVDCIISNNVSYFGTLYQMVAKNCIITDNRYIDVDSTPNTNVTTAAGAMGTATMFFGCLAYANGVNNPGMRWIGSGVNSAIYDSTIVGEGGFNYSDPLTRNTAFLGTSNIPSKRKGVVVANKNMFADSDNGNYSPVPGSALFTDATADTLTEDYVSYGTTSLDGIDYTAESGQPLVAGAYRKASVYPATAHDWYVDAEDGSDANDGLAPGTAKKTLAAVMALVRCGDTVHAAAGTYDEGEMTNTVKLISSAAFMGSRVVIPDGVSLVADEGPDVTFIKGRFGSSGTGYDAHALRGVYMGEGSLLDGFTVTGCQTVAGSGEAENSCGGCVVAPKANVARPAVIRNCRLTNSKARSGAAAFGGVLERCRIDGCSLNSDGLTYYAKLDNCLIVSTNTGVHISALRKYYSVRNCTIYVKNERGDPDFSQAVAGAPIENTILFYDNFEKASTLSNATRCVICTKKTNLTIAATCGSLIEAAAIGDVVDTATYRPVTGSAAIDAGDMGLFAANASAIDCGGGQRVYSGVVDIGAYEYAPFAEMGSALAKRNIAVAEADSDASVSNGDVLLTKGTLEIVWDKKADSAESVIGFEVTGGGVLVVMDATGELGRYTANGAETLKWSPSGTGAKSIFFVYQPAAGDTSATGVVIREVDNRTGFSLIFR